MFSYLIQHNITESSMWQLEIFKLHLYFHKLFMIGLTLLNQRIGFQIIWINIKRTKIRNIITHNSTFLGLNLFINKRFLIL